jgi:DNA-binding HxlR family transcriptional regulator
MRIPLVSELETGEPWKLKSDRAGVAVPILIKSIRGKRAYRLLSEVSDQVILRDTGKIHRLQVNNNSEEAVFIRKGSIIKGDTQTRALTLSILVAPKATTQAEIKCVYASKGIRGGANFEFSGKYTPAKVMSSLRESQSKTWDEVRKYNFESPMMLKAVISDPALNRSIDRMLGNKAGTDDLEGYMSAEENIVDEAMKNIPVDHARQVGLAVIDLDGVAALEIFDHPDSWRALSKSVTRNYAEILNKMAPDIFDINLEKVRQRVESFLGNLRNLDGEEAYSEASYRTYEVRDGKLVGEFTTSGGDLIHVLVTRREDDDRGKPGYDVFTRNLMDRISISEDSRLSPRPAIFNNMVQSIQESLSPIQTQSTQAVAAKKVDYLTKKRGYETIIALKEAPRTFNELQRSTRMSTATVALALKEAEILRLVQKSYRSADASTVYELTEDGKKLEPNKFKATIED